VNTDGFKRRAMHLIARYDQPDMGAYERHIVRLARIWHSIIGARRPVQGIVATVYDELQQVVPSDYGLGWDELKEQFTAWGLDAGWITVDETSGRPVVTRPGKPRLAKR